MKILYLFLIIFLVGCQSVPESENMTKSPILPSWVISQPDSNDLVVAIVPKQKYSSDDDFQLRAAILDAKAQLARNRKTYIDERLETSQTRSLDSLETSFSSVGKQSSSLNLNFSKARVIDRYTAENDDLYILYGFQN